jgi:hypothetical protein
VPLGEVECHLHVFEQLVRKARIDPYPVGFGSSHDSFLPSDAAFGGLDCRVALVLFLTISDPKHYLDVRLEAAPGLKAVPVLDFNAVARQAVQDDCVGRQAQSMARHAAVRTRAFTKAASDTGAFPIRYPGCGVIRGEPGGAAMGARSRQPPSRASPTAHSTTQGVLLSAL